VKYNQYKGFGTAMRVDKLTINCQLSTINYYNRQNSSFYPTDI